MRVSLYSQRARSIFVLWKISTPLLMCRSTLAASPATADRPGFSEESSLRLQLTRHAQDKLATYGIEGDRLVSWRSALSGAEPFLDASTGARGLLMEWEGRPWVVILREDGEAVVTTYPSDARTVMSRRGGGRWIFPNT